MDISPSSSFSSFEKNAEVDPKKWARYVHALELYIQNKSSHLSPPLLQKENGGYCLTFIYPISEVLRLPRGHLLKELTEKVTAFASSHEVMVQFEKGTAFAPQWIQELSPFSTFIAWTNEESWTPYFLNETSRTEVQLGHFYTGKRWISRPEGSAENKKIAGESYRLVIQWNFHSENRCAVEAE